MSCKVSGCRYATFHTTRGHMCGTCKEFGHGQLECGCFEKIDALNEYRDEELPEDKWCEFDYCETRKYHTTQSHFCAFCNCSHRTINDCLYGDLEKTKENVELFLGPEIRNNLESLFGNRDNFYVGLSAGLGNMYYIRKKSGVIQSLFMGDDTWGLYSNLPRFNHLPLYYKFTDGLTAMGSIVNFIYHNSDNDADNDSGNDSGSNNDTDIQGNTFYNNVDLDVDLDLNHKTIKCPLCRNETTANKVITIKGLSEKCKVCMEKEIEKCFTECSHACVCGDCLKML